MSPLIAAGASAALSAGFLFGAPPPRLVVGGYFRKRSTPPEPTDYRAKVKAARAANVARMRRNG